MKVIKKNVNKLFEQNKIQNLKIQIKKLEKNLDKSLFENLKLK